MMKGLILAGGKGTRLRPTTKVTNKHLLLVYDKPLIMYAIETLRENGIKDILLTLSYDCPQRFIHLLGDGSELGVNITYLIHGEAKGIAYAINHAKPYLKDEPFVALLGDNIFANSLSQAFTEFQICLLYTSPSPRD